MQALAHRRVNAYSLRSCVTWAQWPEAKGAVENATSGARLPKEEFPCFQSWLVGSYMNAINAGNSIAQGPGIETAAKPNEGVGRMKHLSLTANEEDN